MENIPSTTARVHLLNGHEHLAFACPRSRRRGGHLSPLVVFLLNLQTVA
jgi:hypothetical protein